MNATRRLLAEVARQPSVGVQHSHKPMIRFIGKHFPPKEIDHTPHTHPASPSSTLPDSFAAYRRRAQQHGPLSTSASKNAHAHAAAAGELGYIGAHSGHDLGPVAAGRGEYFDRSELPGRFRRVRIFADEIEAVESGGASMHS